MVEQAVPSYFCRQGDEPLINKTIPGYFFDIAKRFGNREAIVSVQQGKRLLYSELSTAIDTVARGLLGLGFCKGDRIGVWSTNNVEWVLLQMATARIGAILVTINPAYRTKELSYVLQNAQLHGLFTIPSFRSSDYVAMLVAILPELTQQNNHGVVQNKEFPSLHRVILYDPEGPDQTIRPFPGFCLWQQLLTAAEDVSQDELEGITASLHADDSINIQYTSGTTGFPKAVELTHHNILNNAYFSAQAMAFTENDRLCVPVPFYHCFGMVLANLLCISCGACIVLPCEHFDPLLVLQAIEKERCTAVHGVPTMFIAQLEHPQFNRFDLSSLRTGIMAGAPCPPALMRRVIDEMHCRDILIGYGETEASPLTHLTSIEDSFARRTETVGRNLPHQEVKIIDHGTGQTVAIGEVGEICFRGYHIMKGYYGDPDATKRAVDVDGWLHSGDLGTMDSEGYVKITGRLKEMIIRGGENIYPREIEDYLYTHPKVAEVAVIGIPCEYYGEEVMAWIQLHAGTSATEEEIRAFCRDEIAHFKIPKYIWFVDEFPLTVTGKVQKFRMREIAMERLQENLR